MACKTLHFDMNMFIDGSILTMLWILIGLQVHSKRTIRPWMYSVFMETLMTTISFCLEEKATYEVSSAWT